MSSATTRPRSDVGSVSAPLRSSFFGTLATWYRCVEPMTFPGDPFWMNSFATRTGTDSFDPFRLDRYRFR